MNSPKQRFLESPFHKAFDDISQSPAFRAGLEAAFAEFCWRLSHAPDERKDKAMEGGYSYMHILASLSEVPPPEPSPPRQNLKPPQI